MPASQAIAIMPDIYLPKNNNTQTTTCSVISSHFFCHAGLQLLISQLAAKYNIQLHCPLWTTIMRKCKLLSWVLLLVDETDDATAFSP